MLTKIKPGPQMVVYSVPGQAVQKRCLRLSAGRLARRQDHHPSRCEGSGGRHMFARWWWSSPALQRLFGNAVLEMAVHSRNRGAGASVWEREDLTPGKCEWRLVACGAESGFEPVSGMGSRGPAGPGPLVLWCVLRSRACLGARACAGELACGHALALQGGSSSLSSTGLPFAYTLHVGDRNLNSKALLWNRSKVRIGRLLWFLLSQTCGI